MRRRPKGWGWLLLLACSCVEGPGAESPRPRVTVHDSAGVRIVESAAPLWPESQRWRVDPAPARVIRTSAEPDPPFVLFRVSGIMRLADGRIVALNRGTVELLVFDSAGSYVEAWGREGEGPGELRNPIDLFHCAGDTLVVQERLRASVFSPQGRFARRAELPRAGLGGGQRVSGVARDCSSLLVGLSPDGEERMTIRGTVSDLFHLYSWPLVPGLPAPNRARTVEGTERIGSTVNPFGLRPSWVTDGQRIYYGGGDEAEVTVFDPDGSVIARIRWMARRTAITRRHWEALEREMDRLVAEWDPSVEGLGPTPEQVNRDSMPLFGAGAFRAEDSVPALLVDDERNLWVRQYQRVPFVNLVSELREPPPAQRWWIFDPAGQWLGELKTPDNFRIRSVHGGLLLGVSSDEFGVEEIRMYRIRRDES